MEENIINYLKSLFLWTIVRDKKSVFNKIKKYLPIQDVDIIEDDTVILNFGNYKDTEIIINLKFIWKDDKLVNIKKF